MLTETLSQDSYGWSTEDDDTEQGGQFDFNGDDEDEFGLPSVASSRRAARRAGGRSLDFKGNLSDYGRSSNSSLPVRGGREGRNSSDIAEERGGPAYPTNKPEGKILRPQYKEILRGMIRMCYTADAANRSRSGQFSPPDQSFSPATECHCERNRSTLDKNIANQQVQEDSAGELDQSF